MGRSRPSWLVMATAGLCVVVTIVMLVSWYVIGAQVAPTSPMIPRGRRGPRLSGQALVHVVGYAQFPMTDYDCGSGLTIKVSAYDVQTEVDLVIFQDHPSCSHPDLIGLRPKEEGRDFWVLESLERPQCRRNPSSVLLHSIDSVSSYRLDCGGYQRSYAWWFGEIDVIKAMKRPLSHQQWLQKDASNPVFWAALNCHSQNGREYAIAELSRWVNVSRYGDCLRNVFNHPYTYEYERHGTNMKKGDPLNGIPEELAAKHMFYLSVENSNCKDYVTEKYWKALYAGVIPIVDGPEDYGPFLPHPNAVIRMDAFPSLRHLALYIKMLSQNYTAYMQHMPWKTQEDFEFPNHFKDLVRPVEQQKRDQERLCRLLNQANEFRASGTCTTCCRLPDDSCQRKYKWGAPWYLRPITYVASIITAGAVLLIGQKLIC